MCVFRLLKCFLSAFITFVVLVGSSDASNDPNISLTLISVDFIGEGNYQLRKSGADSWENDKFADDGDPITGAEWIAASADGTGGKNEPVCYTNGCFPKMDATISISQESSSPLRITGVLSVKNEGTTLVSTNLSLMDGGSYPLSGLRWNKSAADTVANKSYILSWEFTMNGRAYPVGTSSTEFFVTAGEPTGSELTAKRLKLVTEKCNGLSDEPEIVNKLWESAGALVVRLPRSPDNLWELFDENNNGECIHITSLFEKMIHITGVSPESGSIMYLFADENKTSYERSSPAGNMVKRNCKTNFNGHTETCGPHHAKYQETEALPFKSEGGAWNAYEACYRYRHKEVDPWIWFAPGSTATFNSVQEVMENFIIKTCWVFWYGPSDAQYTVCGPPPHEPGPEPEYQWNPEPPQN